jgi:hypothetical protein
MIEEIAMGTFNILKTNMQCVNCKDTFEISVQFRFSDTWQHEYSIGNELKWGGNDIGRTGNPIVEVYGIAANNICPHCKFVNQEEFDVIIKNNIIVRIMPIKDIDNYNNADSDGDYFVVT